MKTNIQNILDKIENTALQSEPFGHLVVDNLLPDDLYKSLSKELADEDFNSKYPRGEYGNKERFGVDITDYPSWNKSKRNIATRIHQHNYSLLSSKNDSNIKFFVDLLLENEKDFYSLLCSKLPTERMQDNYFLHISMVKDSLGYEIVPHPDSAENIFTILFYAPETDTNKAFGLDLYREEGTSKNLQLAKQVEFIPNRMIIFAPSASTWHSVNQLSDKLTGTRNSFQIFFYKNAK